nr:NAD-dependent protein deacylase [Paenibacillus shirakamiensis]
MEEQLDQLSEWIQDSSRIVFFGGAGISTESGIPDFRSAAGLYQTEHQTPYTPEQILSRSFFDRHPEVFYDFYRSKMLHPEAQPNAGHQLLAELEREGKLHAIITQNIDGLHQKAGSEQVLELHGSIHRNYCIYCRKFFSLAEIMNQDELVPRCDVCHGMVKPDVVLYEEMLDPLIMEASIDAIRQADLLLVGGTSLTVQPAAHFVSYFEGRHSVLVNITSTSYDTKVDLCLQAPIGSVFSGVRKRLNLI